MTVKMKTNEPVESEVAIPSTIKNVKGNFMLRKKNDIGTLFATSIKKKYG